MDVAMETAGAMGDAASGDLRGVLARTLKAVLGKGDKEQIKALKELLDTLVNEDVPF